MSTLTKIACSSCRTRKIRCDGAEQGSEKCKRCTLTNSPCHFQVHHRGKTLDGIVDLRKHRKRKVIDDTSKASTSTSLRRLNDSRDDNNKRRDSDVQHSNILPGQSPTTSSSNGSSNEVRNNHNHYHSNTGSLFMLPSSPLVLPKPSHDSQEGLLNSEVLEDQDALRHDDAEGSTSAARRNHSERSHDTAEDGEENRTEANISYNIAPNIRSDALANGIASWDRLETLFNFYIRKIDPHAGLLDADLHTVRYTRQQYPLLFSAVTTVAAMFLQAPEYLAMAKSHEALDAFATLSEHNCLDRVLARVAMLIWGTGNVKGNQRSRSRLHRIHQLLTDAMDLYLHVSPAKSRDKDEDEVKIRERGSRRRTWVQLCLIQQTYQSDIVKSTNLILGQEPPTSESFLAECGSDPLADADYRLAASLEIGGVRCDIAQAAHMLHSRLASATLSPIFFASVESRLADLSDQLLTISSKWFIEDGKDVFSRGKLTNYGAQDLYYLIQATRFYLNQVTWLWASCSSEIATNDNSETSPSRPDFTTEETSLTLAPLLKRLPRDETLWFSESQRAALKVLDRLNMMGDRELTHTLDLTYVPASKISLWLSRYSAWFSPTFLYDTQQIMANLIRKCMASTSRRSSALRCFVKLLEAITKNLTPPTVLPNDQISTPRQNFSFANQIQERPHFTGDLTSAFMPIFSALADVNNVQYPIPAASGTMDPWQQDLMPSPSTTTAVPTQDLWRYLDLEDLRRWEELFNIDLQLGQDQ